MLNELHDTNMASASQVVEKVRRFISEKALKPGDKLPTHDDLRHQLGIGLRRLREGLGILEQHGMIRRNRKGGTTVTEPTVEALVDPLEWYLENMGYTLTDLVKARAGVESAAAAQAARDRKARDILVMLDALERMQELQQQGKPDEEAEEAFHMGILSATHNPIMMTFGKLIHIQLRQNQEKNLAAIIPPDPQRLFEEHSNILKAIDEQKPELASALVYNHLVSQLDLIPEDKKQ
jgi:GntR family transcriptional regulator, transcriptional repressor for pyruvate dehydrogenase complex